MRKDDNESDELSITDLFKAIEERLTQLQNCVNSFSQSNYDSSNTTSAIKHLEEFFSRLKKRMASSEGLDLKPYDLDEEVKSSVQMLKLQKQFNDLRQDLEKLESSEEENRLSCCRIC